MYENAAMLAVFLLIYSAIAGRVERSWISGPIVFTAVGFFLGPDGLGVLHINIGGEGLRLLAELTLAMVLFADAANADFSVVRRNLGFPERLLLIGLPLTILLGFFARGDRVPLTRDAGVGIAGGAAGADRRGARQAGCDEPDSAAGYARGAEFGKWSQRRHLRVDRGAASRAGGRNSGRERDASS